MAWHCMMLVNTQAQLCTITDRDSGLDCRADNPSLDLNSLLCMGVRLF